MIRPKKKNGLFSLLCEKNKVGRSEILFKFFKYFYPPALKARGVNCFTFVCLFFCSLKIS